MAAFKSVLILTALEQEKRALTQMIEKTLGKGHVTDQPLSKQLDLHMTRAQLKDRMVTIVKTGVGSVNAAVALTLAHAHTPMDAVVLLGVGGALSPKLDIGDLVISTRVLQHDYYYSFDQGDIRTQPGALILSSAETVGHIAEMDADPKLIEWLKGAESGAKGKVFTGAVLSGNEFVGRVDRKSAIARLLPDALLVEMEAAGVAQLACRLGIPFVVAKTVSDRFSPDGSIESDFATCLDAACAHAASAMHALIV